MFALGIVTSSSAYAGVGVSPQPMATGGGVLRQPMPTEEARAVSFLVEEVPRWPRENSCFSCHNNGDAARALFAAERSGHDVPADAIASTLEWLEAPETWGDQKGEEAFSDVVLTRIQFASALADALYVHLLSDSAALRRAASLVAADQRDDGSWQLDASASLGSPATYGVHLATATARSVLRRAAANDDAARFRAAIARADQFVRGVEVKTVLTAASLLLSLSDAADAPGLAQRRHCLSVIAEGEAPSGGWGPYLSSRPEPFDTALVVLALVRAGGERALIESGRAYLLDQQLDDGSWVETTRPAGQTSYAQYISTTGWALLALIESRDYLGE